MKNKVNAETLRTLRFAQGGRMKFAKVVFWVAGIWGLVVITPLYFLFDLIGKQDPPAITHPGFYYGFAGCVIAGGSCFPIKSNRKYSGVITTNPQIPATQNTTFANFIFPPSANLSVL